MAGAAARDDEKIGLAGLRGFLAARVKPRSGATREGTGHAGFPGYVWRRFEAALCALSFIAWTMLVSPAHCAEPAVGFADCPECPRMVAVPAGRFTMGTSPGEEERERLADEFRGRSEPRREIAVARFALGAYEVTRAQYRRFVEATGRRTDGCFVWSGTAFVHEAARSWRNPGFDQADDHPAVCVSWEDAQAYVEWLGSRTGNRYRLPSEAEWEYAARAGSASIRVWGDDPSAACAHANGADRTARQRAPSAIEREIHDCSDGFPHTAPVGSLRPNAFGLYDMLGNAAEWTQDCWRRDYTGARPDAGANLDGECSLRAVRGGAWDEGPAGLRAAYRVGSPTIIRVYGRGFRVARDF